MKAGWLALGLSISICAGCGCQQESHLPAPEAPTAPEWGPGRKPGKPAQAPAAKVAAPRVEKPKHTPPQSEKLPPLSSFPASREPPAHGLPLEFTIGVPEVPKEIAEPSPPPGKRPPSKPRPFSLW